MDKNRVINKIADFARKHYKGQEIDVTIVEVMNIMSDQDSITKEEVDFVNVEHRELQVLGEGKEDGIIVMRFPRKEIVEED